MRHPVFWPLNTQAASIFTRLVTCAALAIAVGCSNDVDDSAGQNMTACNVEPVVMTTSGGVDFVRTPDTASSPWTTWAWAARTSPSTIVRVP